MSAGNANADMFGQPGFEYQQQFWGDLILGTKAQLQAIGIAVGMAFPGETDGPKRCMTVVDPRGFPCRVTPCIYKVDVIYSASINFPGRKPPRRKFDDFAPGVRVDRSSYSDEYEGTADALTAAGLVLRGQLPGQPGMRKVRVTILPDGTLPKGGPTANCSEAHDPGAKQIERVSGRTYRVTVVVPHEEQSRRHDEEQRADLEWKDKMRSLPRPAPLIPLPQDPRLVAKMPMLIKERSNGNVIYLRRAL